jgi:hypothetical protein
VEAFVNTIAFDVLSVAACISIIAAVILLIATPRAEQRIAIILLCSGFLVSGVSRLIGLTGTNATLMLGASLGFTLSALVVAVLRRRHAV